MPNLIDRTRSAVEAFRSGTGGPATMPGTSPERHGTPALIDKGDPKPEVLLSDMAKPPEIPGEQKRRMVEYIQSAYKASSAHRRQRSYLWEQCKRFDQGEQWLLINDAKGVVDSREDDEIKRCVTFNHVTRLVTKMEAMATQSEPEAYPVPVTDTPLDRQACAVAEAIIADEYRKLGINTFRGRQARSAIVQTSCYRYWRWDKDKEALIPQYDPLTGQVVRAVKSAVGGLEVDLLPGQYVYFDPSAQSKADATWLIIARTKPLVVLQQAYPDAYGVQPDATLSGDTYAPIGDNNNAATLAGGISQALGSKKARPNAALTLEYLERPNAKHPEGVYAVVAGDKLLHLQSWPWADKENWPLAEMAFLPVEDSPHAQGAMEHLIEAQAIVNEELSRIKARLDKDKRVIYVQRLSEIGADAFEELRDLIKIYYNPGSAPPTPSNLPPISPDHFTMLNMAIDFLQTFSGIVDVLSGDVPPGVTAGVAIDMMVREASTQFKPFINSLEQCEVDFCRGVISEYADKAPLELMIGMDRKGNPRGSAQDRAPVAQPMSLQALADGGMVDIYLVPGSGMPRSEAGKKSERTQNFSQGLYGVPGSPEALKLYWSLTNESDSHKVLESLDEQEQKQGMIAQLQDALAQAQQQIAELTKQGQAPSAPDPEMQAALAEHQSQLKAEADHATDTRRAQMAADADTRKMAMGAAADGRKTKKEIAMQLLKMHGDAARQAAQASKAPRSQPQAMKPAAKPTAK